MSRQSIWVAAASAAFLAGCGGGGSSTPATTNTPVTPTTDTAFSTDKALKCGVSSVLPVLGSGAHVLSSADTDDLLTTVKDSAAVLAGTCLLTSFKAGGPNQFGGRSATESSLGLATDDIACGVYQVDSTSPELGDKLAATAGSNTAVYCAVVHAVATDTANDTKTYYRHYFKISEDAKSTSAAPFFNIDGYAESYLVNGSNSKSTVNEEQLYKLRNLTASFGVNASGLINSYVLSGDLPQPVGKAGASVQGSQRLAISISGALGAGTTSVVAGYVGKSELIDAASSVLDTLTFNSGTQLSVVYSSTGLGAITLYGWLKPV